jgi:hypothetical protein
MKNFPDYPSHNGVECFNCGAPLDASTVEDTGTPSGRWAQTCRKCGVRTFYDLGRDPDEAYDLRKERPKWPLE